MKRTKQGISLIVLVITIIVMIILAAAIMITLSSTGVIGKANTAVQKSDLQEAKHIAALAWSDAYLAGITEPDEVLEAIRAALVQNNVNPDLCEIVLADVGADIAVSTMPADWKASVREVTEDGVPIPIGFVKSPYENEGEKDKGLVIYALTPDEIEEGVTDIVAIDGKDGALTEEQAHYESLIKRNQFVWVPVDSDKFETLFKRSNNGMKASDGIADKYILSTTLGEEYWELVLETNNMPSQNTTEDNIQDYVSPATLLEATKMYESVQKYGGFYIARYEVGSKEVAYLTIGGAPRGYVATRATKSNISNLSVTMGKYPYNLVAWGTSMSDETSDDGAVSLARAFYPSTGTTYGVVSTLTYGVEWDRTLSWWEEQDALDGVDNLDLTNSTSYGVYNDTTIASADLNAGAKYSIYVSNKFGAWNTITEKTSRGNWLLTTGGYKKSNVYNIYDMAGNLWECTMEGYSSDRRVNRGGYFGSVGGSYPVATRGNISPTAVGVIGFRPSLYIK